MNRKILIIKDKPGIWTFLLEAEEVVEIHFDKEKQDSSRSYLLGNIYIGKVKRIIANIGAAFVEIAPDAECYYDISQARDAIFTKKAGKKDLCVGDELVVQISKDAVKTKVPTVSSNISFSGHYGVLTSGNTRIGVSAKLAKKQREEYKELLKPYENEEYGLIIRTNAKDMPFEEVQKELDQHIRDFHQFKQMALTRTCFSCLKSAPPSYISNLKNIYMEGLTEIVVDDLHLYNDICAYYKTAQPGQVGKIRLYQDSMVTLASLYNTDREVRRALSEKIWLKNGAYLVIQPTEGLTVIDVNSGKYIKKEEAADSWLKINLEAAREVAKQLRLRNISGIVIVDFINMDDEEDTGHLLKELKDYLAKDPIQTTLVDMTALQLVEITRKKIRKPLYESVDFNVQ